MSLRAIIVDDEPPARERLRSMLAESGDCEVAGEASNGAEALDLVERLEPDIVLLDVRMPGIDGFETAAAIRSVERFKRTPIIFLSAHGDRRAVPRDPLCRFMRKPVDPDAVRQHLKRLVQA